MSALTAYQQQRREVGAANRSAVLRRIEEGTLAHGFPPPIREIRRQTGLGLATIHGHIQDLLADGVLDVRTIYNMTWYFPKTLDMQGIRAIG